MPYYQSINGRKYEYADEQPAGYKPIAPGRFPMFGAKGFGDIVGNAREVVLKRHARILSHDKRILDEFGSRLHSLLSSTKSGDLLQPVKILRVGLNRRNPPSTRGDYVIVFENGVSLLASSLEAVLNHPTMTIHGVDEGNRVSLMVEGEVVGVIAGAGYAPEHAVTIWELETTAGVAK